MYLENKKDNHVCFTIDVCEVMFLQTDNNKGKEQWIF